MLGRFGACPAFQLAQNQNGPIVRGQAADLVVDDRAQLGHRIRLDFRLGQHRHLHFVNAPPGSQGPAVQGRPMSHAVEPVAEHVSGRDGSRLAREDKKRGLERILGVVVIAQNPPADAPDHGPVT